ncbi:MAG: hypothetical protein ACLQBX_05210 [Candidatus Limnocylindrales bacterium]
MTTTEERAETTDERKDCPAWCEGCTPAAEGGVGHFSDHTNVDLDLMPPRKVDDRLHGLPGYYPVTLSAYLAQPHGAALPTIHLTTDVEGDNGSILTFEEATELIEILGDLLNQGTAAVFAAATPKHSIGTLPPLTEVAR